MKVIDFLRDLSSDSNLLIAYVTDPVGTMDRAGIGKDDQIAILSGERDRISALLGGATADIKIMICINLTDPA